jgi:hypothetical protein
MERVRVGEGGIRGKKREGERGDERKKGGERIESCGRDNKDGKVMKVTTMNRKSCGTCAVNRHNNYIIAGLIAFNGKITR